MSAVAYRLSDLVRPQISRPPRWRSPPALAGVGAPLAALGSAGLRAAGGQLLPLRGPCRFHTGDAKSRASERGFAPTDRRPTRAQSGRARAERPCAQFFAPTEGADMSQLDAL